MIRYMVTTSRIAPVIISGSLPGSMNQKQSPIELNLPSIHVPNDGTSLDLISLDALEARIMTTHEHEDEIANLNTGSVVVTLKSVKDD
jgi:hypothetical protein